MQFAALTGILLGYRTLRGFTGILPGYRTLRGLKPATTKAREPSVPNPKVCAICGFGNATTRDHVPPKGMFPLPLPVKLITVPACSKCNNGAATQDERFRVYLSMATSYSNTDATRLWKERTSRTLGKNAALKREIFASVQAGQAAAPGHHGTPFFWPVSAYSPVLERMARGLYWHHYGSALGNRAECKVDFLYSLPSEIDEIMIDWNQGYVGNDQFVYRYASVLEEPLRTAWIFQFFNSHWGCVETFPAGGVPLKELRHSPPVTP